MGLFTLENIPKGLSWVVKTDRLQKKQSMVRGGQKLTIPMDSWKRWTTVPRDYHFVVKTKLIEV